MQKAPLSPIRLFPSSTYTPRQPRVRVSLSPELQQPKPPVSFPIQTSRSPYHGAHPHECMPTPNPTSPPSPPAHDRQPLPDGSVNTATPRIYSGPVFSSHVETDPRMGFLFVKLTIASCSAFGRRGRSGMCLLRVGLGVYKYPAAARPSRLVAFCELFGSGAGGLGTGLGSVERSVSHGVFMRRAAVFSSNTTHGDGYSSACVKCVMAFAHSRVLTMYCLAIYSIYSSHTTPCSHIPEKTASLAEIPICAQPLRRQHRQIAGSKG